jgi:hypothetical protein
MVEITDSVSRGSSDEIRADIERTRAEMDSTFDALDQKLTPSQLLAEAWRYTKGGSSVGASKIWSLARQHPLPATMIGVGLGWLLVERSRANETNVDIDYFDEDLEPGRFASAAGAVKDAAGNAVDTVKDAASTAYEKVHDLTDTVKDRASEWGETAQQKASGLRKKAKTQTRKVKTGFWQMMEENPLAVGAAVLTLGAIAGFSLPSTDKEDELLGESRDHLLDTVKEKGQEALEKGKHVAESAVETLKHEAEAQGLTPESLVDKVKTVGREAKNAVTEEAKKQNLTLDADTNAGNSNKPAENKPAEQREPELARR